MTAPLSDAVAVTPRPPTEADRPLIEAIRKMAFNTRVGNLGLSRSFEMLAITLAKDAPKA